MRTRIGAVAALTFLSICMVLVVWWIARPGPETISGPWVLDTTARIAKGVVRVSGSTSLPEGALLHVYAWHDAIENAAAPSPFDWESTVAVKDERFIAEFAPIGWPRGRVNIVVSFSVDGDAIQPSQVVAAVGAGGISLTGPAVTVGEDGARFLSASTSIDLR